MLRVRPLVELTDAGYDDNILARVDDPVSDYTATVSPSVDGLLLFGSRAFLTFRERLDLTGYLDNTDQNYVNQRGDGRVTVPFGRFGVFSDFRLDRVEEQPIDLEDIRPTRKTNGLGFGFIVRVGARTEVEVRRSDTRFRHSDPDFDSNGQSIGERLDRDRIRTSMEIDYELVGADSPDLRRGDRRDRVHRPRSRGPHQGLRFLERAAGGQLRARRGTLSPAPIQMGWAKVEADDPEIADFSDFIGSAELLYRPIRRARVGLEWNRQPAFSIYEDALYLLDRQHRAGRSSTFSPGPLSASGPRSAAAS